MTDLCTIGPVSITDANLADSNTFSFSNDASRTVASGTTLFNRGQFDEEYKFDIICSYDEALQLKGIVEQGEVIWMNTSDLTDNDYFQHKGWVLLTSLDVSWENSLLAQCSIKYVKISDHEKEYLSMSYSRGIYDGVNIDPTYDPVSTVYQLNEDGSDATTHWSNICRYPGGGGSSTWTADSGELKLSNTAVTAGTYRDSWVFCDQDLKSKGGKFSAPFTLEVEVDTLTAPTSGKTGVVGVGISPSVYGTLNKKFPVKGYKEYLNCITTRSNTARGIYVDVTLSTGKTKRLVPYISVSTTGNVVWKVQMYYNGYVRISTNVNGAGYVQRYYGPSNLPNYKRGLHLTLSNRVNDTTAYTVGFDNIKVYNNNTATFPNMVPYPVGATPLITADTTRTTSDGTMSYAINPDDMLPFSCATADLYKGSVKLLSTNNATSTSRQVFGTDIKLTPTTTTLHNGLTRLTFDSDEMILSGYYSAQWNELNRYDFGSSIDLLRPIRITPNIVVLQINNSKVTMTRGGQVVMLEHPYADIAYTLFDRYYHDAITTSSPGAGADITMEDVNSGYYATIYNNASPNYRNLIVKVDPCTILSDSLPADDITGLGWVYNSATGYHTADKLAQEFYMQTRSGVSIKQII